MGAAAQGGGQGAGDARRCRGANLERRPCHVPRRKGGGDPRPEQPTPVVRHTRRAGGDAAGPKDVALKEPKDFRLLGTRVTRLDTPGKVDGSALFGIDIKVPGMLIASIERSPVLGGRVKRFDPDRARAMPGVRHVVELEPSSWMGSKGGWAAGCAAGVAVVADTHWQAVGGRRARENQGGG